MEENSSDFLFPSFSLDLPADANNGTTIIEEGPAVCPLCHSQLCLLYVNLTEKILMCENTECEYPFGHDDIIFYKTDDIDNTFITTNNENPEKKTPNPENDRKSPNIDNIQHVPERKAFLTTVNEIPNIESIKTAKKNEAIIFKDIAEIRKLNMELSDEKEQDAQIRNTEWIKNLKSLGDMSGTQLLQPEEIQALESEESVKGQIIVDLDLEENGNTIPEIKIGIIEKKS